LLASYEALIDAKLAELEAELARVSADAAEPTHDEVPYVR
jgi:hypothetical protein